jgi:uncharacterized phage-associated protein
MKAVDMAKDIVYLCKKYGYDFNNTKIQKLLYLFVGFCLVNNIDEVEKIDDMPRLWPYGPVFPKVHKKYNEIAKSENDKITSVKNPEIIEILEKTVEKWGIVSAGALSAWSHSEGSPWDMMVDRGEKWNSTIPLIAIKMYFGRRVENVLS